MLSKGNRVGLSHAHKNYFYVKIYIFPTQKEKETRYFICAFTFLKYKILKHSEDINSQKKFHFKSELFTTDAINDAKCVNLKKICQIY